MKPAVKHDEALKIHWWVRDEQETFKWQAEPRIATMSEIKHNYVPGCDFCEFLRNIYLYVT